MRTVIKAKKIVRIFLIGSILWAIMLLSASAAEISDITVEMTKNDTNILIEGGYDSYIAFTEKAPARLVIDFKGTRPKKDLLQKHPINVDGPIVSRIRIGSHENRVRIVVDSAEKDEPFHYNIGEIDGNLRIKCWRPGKVKTASASKLKSEQALEPIFPQKELSDLLGLTEMKEDIQEEEVFKKIPTYSGEKIVFDAYQEDLHNVFRIFGQMFQKNFIVDDRVKGTLTLSLRDVPWDMVMDIIIDMKNLQREERGNILVIKPKGPKKTQGELKITEVKDERLLYPAKIKKKAQQEQQKSREFILKAHNLEKEGKTEEALELYENAFSLSKKNIDLAKKTAYLHYRMEHYARSYFFAKEALKLNTQDTEAALYAALSASQIDKEDESMLFFEAAISSRPKLPEAFYNYGLFLTKKGDYKKAHYIYQRYEDIFGPSLDVSLGVARVYEAEGKETEACKRYREISFSGFSMDEATENMIQEKIESLCGQGG